MAKAFLVLAALFLSLSDSVLSEQELGLGNGLILLMAPAPAPTHHHKAPAPAPTHHHHHHKATAPPPTHHHHHHKAPAPAPTHHHAPTQAPVHPPTHHHAPTQAPVHPPTHHHAPTQAPAHPPTHHHAPSVAPVHPPTHHAPVPAVSPMPPHRFPRSFVAVQGVVYCKSCKYPKADTLQGASPLMGAIVKLVCNNTKYRPIVAQSTTDKNGYFLVKAPKTVTSYAAHTCKVSVSPVASCSKPTGFLAGALRPEKQFVADKLPFVLYTVGPLAFGPTCKPT